ncbi:MAG: AraC family transcriptional regulator [Deltaproteobacteria bacterium]|nr:AraC family transcriptional regulator [Deltaproteobacteria bacterium]
MTAPTPEPDDGHDDGEQRVLASMVLGTAAAFATLGPTHAELLDAAGLAPSAVEDPDALIEYEALVRLWAFVLERFPDRPLGMALARQGAQIRRQSLGVFGYAVQHCRDVRQSLALLIRYCPLVFPRIALELHVAGGQAQLRVDHEPRVVAMIEPIELLVASLTLDLAAIDAQLTDNVQVCFRHAPKHSADVYAEFFGPAVQFGSSWTGLAFDAVVLDQPISGADPQIGKYLRQLADAQLEAARPPSDEPTLDARVRTLIDERLMAGRSDQASVARALGMSPRTLQRRLDQLDTSFGRLLEHVRHERALQLLTVPQLSVGEVAFMLGYTNPRPFYRSFRRWTGRTPSQWRADQD